MNIEEIISEGKRQIKTTGKFDLFSTNPDDAIVVMEALSKFEDVKIHVDSSSKYFYFSSEKFIEESKRKEILNNVSLKCKASSYSDNEDYFSEIFGRNDIDLGFHSIIPIYCGIVFLMFINTLVFTDYSFWTYVDFGFILILFFISSIKNERIFLRKNGFALSLERELNKDNIFGNFVFHSKIHDRFGLIEVRTTKRRINKK